MRSIAVKVKPGNARATAGAAPGWAHAAGVVVFQEGEVTCSGRTDS